MAEKTEIVANEFGVDVAVNTIRGRACPVCGGKIIPSNRAVYQSAGDPTEVFPLWECERCGFAETFAKPEEPKKVHGAAAKALTGEKAAGGAALTPSATRPGTPSAGKAAGRAAAKRAMPPDVRKMLEVMNRAQPKAEE
jgi:hypothetical protein